MFLDPVTEILDVSSPMKPKFLSCYCSNTEMIQIPCCEFNLNVISCLLRNNTLTFAHRAESLRF